MGLFGRKAAAPLEEGEEEETEELEGDEDLEEDAGKEAEADEEAAGEEEEKEEHHEGEEEEELEEEEEEEEEEEAAPGPPILPRLAAVGHRLGLWPYWTPVLLVLIFSLALFIRSYFYWQAAWVDYVDVPLLSGNDPNYHKRAVDYLDHTHRWLTHDPLQNFPLGAPNPNPPAYETAVLLIGYLMSPFAHSTDEAVWWSMQLGGAIWASLTIFPVYFVAREMFGKRAGILAAFLIAVMAGNVERTPVGFSDHDGFLVFFIVAGFYFYIRAMEYTKNRFYVKDWASLDSTTRGFLAFLHEHRVAILYSLLAATMWSITALAWKGFPYIYAIVLAYYFVQVIAMRFRREDPFAVAMLTMITFTWVIVLTLPYYYGMNFMHWYEIFYLLWAAAALVTLFFVPTRDTPWVLVVLLLALITASFFLVLNFFAPEIADTIFSGAGYFSRNKLYTTIAEAQPPDVSRLVASYGYATSLLALAGVGLMAWRLPRRWSNAYVLMVLWAAAAIYMALTAVRFMYNATPVFAIVAGWMLWGIVDKTGFSLKLYRDRWAKYVSWRKLRTFPVHHIAVAFFAAFMVVMPNTMQGLDAGIPFETKKEWDVAIYNFMPDPLGLHLFRPDPSIYKPQDQGKLWYVGAFGTSFMNDYWAVSMRWLAAQDNDLPEGLRPGFISWWDYGHWAMQVGEHPTVADNFQNGFEWAGNFIGAQGEDNASALILTRFLDQFRDDPRLVPVAKGYLGDDGYAEYRKYVENPTPYIQQIRDSPEKYGRKDYNISENNARTILVSKVVEERVSLEGMTWWIRDIKDATGLEMRYFAVDSRLMPYSVSRTGIFYAPIILADFDRNDFVEIRCQLTSGGSVPCDQVTNPRLVKNTEIVYKESFYNSMFTRAFLGYTSFDMKGQGLNGMPGLTSTCTAQSGCLASQPPMQGWNMSHWRLVHRSVYFNPNRTDLANHSKEWRIITDEKADAYDGNENVTVDRQYLGLGERTQGGVMYLKYYAGAFINGTVYAVDSVTGRPQAVPNARVTVYDDVRLLNPTWIGIPHGYTTTDENGRFSILAPFGNVTLLASTGGGPDPFMLREQVELGRAHIPVSDEQAMRIGEYNLSVDILVSPGTLRGRAYIDNNTNARFDEGTDLRMPAAQLSLHSDATNLTYNLTAAADGTYALRGLPPGLYQFNATYAGHNWSVAPSVRINANQSTTQDVAPRPAKVAGAVTGQLGEAIANLSVHLEDLQTGELHENVTDAAGHYAFTGLLPGNYTVRSEVTNATPFERQVSLALGDNQSFNFTSIPTAPVALGVFVDQNSNGSFDPGEGLADVNVEVKAVLGDYFNLTRTGAGGLVDARFPAGNYTLRADVPGAPGGRLAAIASVEAPSAGATWSLELRPAAHFNGTVFRDENNNTAFDPEANVTEITFGQAEVVFTNLANGQATRLLSRPDGHFDLALPEGNYTVRVIHSQPGQGRAQVAFLTREITLGTTQLDIPLINGTKLTGKVGFDADRNGVLDESELIPDANLSFVRADYNVTLNATARGDFTVWLEEANWSVTGRMPGYLTNSTFALLNASDAANNTKDLFLDAELVTVKGLLGNDRDGNGTIDPGEGFANVTLRLEPVTFAGAYGYGVETNTTTDASGNFTASIPVGRYKYNLSFDVGSGALAHRYQTFNATTRATVFEVLIGPRGAPFELGTPLRELTRVEGVVWYDSDGSGVPEPSKRPAGATVTLRGPGEPIPLVTRDGGAFEGWLPSALYTAEGAYAVQDGKETRFFTDVNLTTAKNLGFLEFKALTAVSVHVFNDKDQNGIEDEENATIVNDLTISFTNVTTSQARITFGNGSIQLLPGRVYHYILNETRIDIVGTFTISVLWQAEGDFSFTGSNPQLVLPVPRRLQVTGAFYWDRNGDGRYTPGEREEPIGAFLEFRNTTDASRVVLRQAVEPMGSYSAYLPLGRYNITVDHPGFDTTNASWALTVTENPGPTGFKVDVVLRAHDVELTGYLFLDVNRNGQLNRYETGMPVNALWLFNASNLTESYSLSTDSTGRYNITLKPGTYNLYAVGDVAGTPVAGLAQVEVDPVGGLAWGNVSLRQAFFVNGSSWFLNTTGANASVPGLNYTVGQGGVQAEFPAVLGAYNISLPDGAFRINATLTTQEFGTSMNYTAEKAFTLDLENLSRNLNFTKVHIYTVTFNWTPPGGEPLPQNASVNYTSLVTNTGTDNATFDISVPPGSQPAGWTYVLEANNLTLEIGETKTLWIAINTSNQTRAGDNTLQVRAVPRNVSGEGGFIDLKVNTRQDFAFDARQDVDAPSDQGDQTTYFLAVENKGNGIDKIRITVLDVPQGYTATVNRGGQGSELELQPFRTEKLQLTLKRNVTAPPAPEGTTLVLTFRSVSSPANETHTVEVPLVYSDLKFGSATNATRVDEAGRSLIEARPLTTPGFELAAALGSVVLLAAAARRRRMEGSP